MPPELPAEIVLTRIEAEQVLLALEAALALLYDAAELVAILAIEEAAFLLIDRLFPS
jgi:hypothetical protein